jgi:hypothetical protein
MSQGVWWGQKESLTAWCSFAFIRQRLSSSCILQSFVQSSFFTIDFPSARTNEAAFRQVQSEILCNVAKACADFIFI